MTTTGHQRYFFPLILFFAAAIAFTVAFELHRNNLTERQERFKALSTKTVKSIVERIHVYDLGLKGARGAIAAIGPENITHDRFRHYVESRDIPAEFPGSHGFGFIRRVDASSVKAFIESNRREGRRDFSIHQITPNSGEMYVIQYIEPEASNSQAIGLDIASEPRRSEAAHEAELNNRATLTRPITLLQSSEEKSGGFLLLLPVYQGDQTAAPNKNSSRKAYGWVYTPLIMSEVMDRFDFREALFRLSIYDRSDPADPIPAYDSTPTNHPLVAGLVEETEEMVFGRQWRFEVHANTAFIEQLHQTSPWKAGLIVFLIELVLLALFIIYQQWRLRSRQAYENHAQLAAIVESSSDAVIGKKLDGTVISWNRAAEEMFGYRKEEAVGHTLASLLVPPELMDEEVRILDRLAMGEKIPHFETVRKRKDGGRIYVSVAVSPICNEKGEVIGASKTVRDITRQKAAEEEVHKLNATLESEVEERTRELNLALEEAKQASRSKAEFLANMSHEIRTPMNAVLGLAYLAEQQTIEPATRDIIRKISNAGRSLLRIINDILDFSKIEEKRLELDYAAFDLSSVMDNLATIMGSYAGEKRIELIISPLPHGVRYLKGDALRLEQVLINLTSNAIKFTENGHVMVTTRAINDEENKLTLKFSVQDTGIGIPQEKQTSIFDPFIQADTSTTRRFGGTGLGLAICRQLVNLMQGEIGITSAVGHGSEFWFTVAFEKSDTQEFSSTELSALNVLIADDNVLALDALKITSEQLGWKTQAFDNGKDAIEAVLSSPKQKNHPDVVVLDWQMPEVDGLEVARTIREELPEGNTPIVVMVTAYSREQLTTTKNADIPDAVLTKPVTASALYDAVAAAMQARGKINTLQPTSPTVKKRLQYMRILVVDDSEINRDLAKHIFSNEGAKISLANNGLEAVRLVEADHNQFDLILMDVQMPIMDGLEATSRIRQVPECLDLPIIGLTAGAFTTQRASALAAGMNTVVTKPFNVDTTISLMREISGRNAAKKAELSDAGHLPSPKLLRNGSPPGIDLERGLAIWTDVNVYKKYLSRFTHDYGKFIDSISGIPPEEVSRAVHKLKGAAASLGLTTISVCAGHVDDRLSVGHCAEHEIARLDEAISTALISIDVYVSNSDCAAKFSKFEFDAEHLTELTRQMYQALDQDNPTGVGPILEKMKIYLPALTLKQLSDFVDSYEFRKAEDELASIVASLKK